MDRTAMRPWLRRVTVGIATIAAAGYVAWNAYASNRPAHVRAALSIETTLGGADTAGFARASTPRPFRFPADHGPHPEFRNEWWYLTGNLSTDSGRRFGYQLTLFRTALAPDSPDRTSAWATRQAWMAHFAVTDADQHEFHAFERFARGAVGLAGADTAPLRVWLESWSIRSAGTGTFLPLRVVAADSSVAIDLDLTDGDPPVLNGDHGLSRKGPTPGNASFYFSLPRISTAGTVTIHGQQYLVSGSTWIDREWSTSALAPGVVGWDWFALQLDDASEIMLYRLRRDDGSTDPFSAGTFIAPAGSVTHLVAADLDVRPTGEWVSPVDGTRYPARWSLRIEKLDLSLDVTPVLADQEHAGSFRYWEGAVDVAGTRQGRTITGAGYVELTGYAGDPSRSAIARQNSISRTVRCRLMERSAAAPVVARAGLVRSVPAANSAFELILFNNLLTFATMPKGVHLGEFELVVMLAAAQCGDNAHGAAIHREIVGSTGRDVSIASVYVTLARLEKKGLLGARAELGGPERSGRARKVFEVTPAGIEEMQLSRIVLDRLWRGLSFDPVGD